MAEINTGTESSTTVKSMDLRRFNPYRNKARYDAENEDFSTSFPIYRLRDINYMSSIEGRQIVYQDWR